MKDYVNSAALQEYTTKLVAKLKTLFPGTPTAAATVADMTDHSKTYVYVGSETGYTAGDWYYWDGTAWTSGGPFQATSIITDTTLAVAGEAADAKATGDAIAAAKTAVLNAMAPAYSTSATYAVGNYVNHNGKVYRCTTAITTAEAWTAGHWTEVPLGADLASQVSDLKTQFDQAATISRDDLEYFELIKNNLDDSETINETLSQNTLKNYYLTPSVEFNSGGGRYIIEIELNNVTWWNDGNPNHKYYMIVATTLGESATGSSQVELIQNYPTEAPTSGKLRFAFEPTARATRLRVGCYFGTGEQKASIKLYKEKSVIKEKVDSLYSEFWSFQNDMCTTPDGMPNHTIKTMGLTGKYGDDNACYTFTGIPSAKTVHIAFEWQYTSNQISKTSDFGTTLFSIYDGVCSGSENLGACIQNGSNIGRQATFKCNSNGANNNTSFVYVGGSFRYDQTAKQKDALSIQATGTPTTAEFGFDNNVLTITINGTDHTINYTDSETIDELVEDINNIDGIIATSILGSRTVAELMPVALRNYSQTYNLIASGTLYDGTSYTDTPPIYIPIVDDVSDWRTAEAVVDIESAKCYVSIDGLLMTCDIDTANIVVPTTITIGKIINNASTSPIRVRNLRIDYGSYGDAEIIDYINYPNNNGVKQMISELNPKLVIFEGHGIDVCTESKAPLTDNAAVSTERLNIIFDHLAKAGYVNVSYDDIVEWKLGNRKLPKRSFCLMFDDFRLTNYLDADSRKPFEKYGVKGGLALITNRFDDSSTYPISANGVTYDSGTAVIACESGGWYLASHTYNHTTLTSVKPSEDISVLFNSAVDCTKHCIPASVIVYPQGGCKMETIPIVRNSPFSIAINVVSSFYNCKAISRYSLIRNEIGTRAPLSDVLAGLN